VDQGTGKSLGEEFEDGMLVFRFILNQWLAQFGLVDRLLFRHFELTSERRVELDGLSSISEILSKADEANL
jgi:hypothetical protein